MSDRDACQSADEDDLPKHVAEEMSLTDDEQALGEIAEWGPAEDWSGWADATG